MSHLKCWKKIIESGEDYGLILEDDAACNLQIAKIENVIKNKLKYVPEDWDFFFVGGAYSLNHFKRNINVFVEQFVTNDSDDPWFTRCHAYLIKRQTCMDLINSVVIGPFDNWLALLANDINIYRLKREIFKQDDSRSNVFHCGGKNNIYSRLIITGIGTYRLERTLNSFDTNLVIVNSIPSKIGYSCSYDDIINKIQFLKSETDVCESRNKEIESGIMDRVRKVFEMSNNVLIEIPHSDTEKEEVIKQILRDKNVVFVESNNLIRAKVLYEKFIK